MGWETLGKIGGQITKVGTNCCQMSGWHQCTGSIGHKNLTVVLLLSKEIILQSTMRLTQRPALGGGLEFGA